MTITETGVGRLSVTSGNGKQEGNSDSNGSDMK